MTAPVHVEGALQLLRLHFHFASLLQDLAAQVMHLALERGDALRVRFQDLRLPLQVRVQQLQVLQLIALVPAASKAESSAAQPALTARL